MTSASAGRANTSAAPTTGTVARLGGRAAPEASLREPSLPHRPLGPRRCRRPAARRLAICTTSWSGASRRRSSSSAETSPSPRARAAPERAACRGHGGAGPGCSPPPGAAGRRAGSRARRAGGARWSVRRDRSRRGARRPHVPGGAIPLLAEEQPAHAWISVEPAQEPAGEGLRLHGLEALPTQVGISPSSSTRSRTRSRRRTRRLCLRASRSRPRSGSTSSGSSPKRPG